MQQPQASLPAFQLPLYRQDKDVHNNWRCFVYYRQYSIYVKRRTMQSLDEALLLIPSTRITRKISERASSLTQELAHNFTMHTAQIDQ